MTDQIRDMPLDTEEESNASWKLIEKRDGFSDAVFDLKRSADAYEIQYYAKVGFRCKALEHVHREYADEKTTYWKFSQSHSGVAGEAGVYANYIPGIIVESGDKDCGLSFVRDDDLYKCWMYGDQITKVVFDLGDKQFAEIADFPAYETGNTFGEIKTDYLIPQMNYLLSSPETVVRILKLSGKNRVDAAMTLFIIPSFREPMERFGFIATSCFIDFVRQQSSEKEEPAVWISKNIDDLYTKFKIQEYNRGEVSITGYLFFNIYGAYLKIKEHCLVERV